MAIGLEKNSGLTEVDLSNNRINKECLEKLLLGLWKNTTLRNIRASAVFIYILICTHLIILTRRSQKIFSLNNENNLSSKKNGRVS